MPTPNQNPRPPFPAWRLRKGVKNASDDELEAAVDSCESWGWAGGGILLVGLLGELVLAIAHPPKDSSWEEWGTVLGTALVFIGVAIEVQFSRMGHRRQGELTARSKRALGEANERAAKAYQKAEEEGLARAKIEERLQRTIDGSRVFTDEDKAHQLVALLSQFAGKKFHIVVGSTNRDPNSEQARFGAQVKRILELAGWVQAKLNLPIWSPATKRGVTIGYRSDSDASVAVAKAVGAALRSFDIASFVEPILDLDPDTFLIEIGMP